MSVELLRGAAAKLREHAEAAQAGPWMTGETAPHLVNEVVYGQSTGWPGHITQACNVEYADGGMPNARYIALMHPPVALALADVLDGTAEEFDGVPSPELAAQMYAADIVLARAILREPAEREPRTPMIFRPGGVA